MILTINCRVFFFLLFSNICQQCEPLLNLKIIEKFSTYCLFLFVTFYKRCSDGVVRSHRNGNGDGNGNGEGNGIGNGNANEKVCWMWRISNGVNIAEICTRAGGQTGRRADGLAGPRGWTAYMFLLDWNKRRKKRFKFILIENLHINVVSLNMASPHCQHRQPVQ